MAVANSRVMAAPRAAATAAWIRPRVAGASSQALRTSAGAGPGRGEEPPVGLRQCGQPLEEHADHGVIEGHVGEIAQRLGRDRQHCLAHLAPQLRAERHAFRCDPIKELAAPGVRIRPGLFEQPGAGRRRFRRRLGKQRGALLCEFLGLVAEGLALGDRLGLRRRGRRHLVGDPLLARADRLQDGSVQQRFSSHTRIRKLSACATTVNQSISMAHFPAAWAMTLFQNGLAKIRIIETTKQ